MFYLILCHEKSWMTCDYASLQQYFMAYQEILRVKMKGCVDWNSVYGQDFEETSARAIAINQNCLTLL